MHHQAFEARVNEVGVCEFMPTPHHWEAINKGNVFAWMWFDLMESAIKL